MTPCVWAVTTLGTHFLDGVDRLFEGQRPHARLGGVDRDLDHGGCMRLKSGVIVSAFDSLKVLFEPFEDRFHNFICPLPIHVEVYAAF